MSGDRSDPLFRPAAVEEQFATKPWVPRLGGLCTILLLAGSLVFLQVLNAEKDLIFCLPAYGVVAIAALTAIATLRSQSTGNLPCLLASTGWFGYIIIRALTSPAPYAARSDLYTVLGALTLYGLTLCALTAAARRITLIVSLLAFAVVHVLVGVIQAGLGENFIVVSSLENVERSARATGFYVNPDHLAGLLEVLGVFGLSITCWSRWPSWSKVFIAYLAGICYLGVVLTGSRAGYLSALASLALFALLSLIVLWSGGMGLVLRFGGSGLLLLAMAITAAVLLIYQIPPLRERVQTLFTDEGRLDLWQAAVEQWKLQPWMGTGSGTYLFYGRQFRSERMQADPVEVHNDYLHLLCEYGLAGAAGFLLFFSVHIRQAWRTFLRMGPQRVAAGNWPLSDRLALNIGAISAIGAYLVHSALDFNLHIPANALLLAFVFGVVANPDIERTSGSSGPRASLIPKLGLAVLGFILLLQCARLLPGEYYGERARTSLRDEDPSGAVRFANKALAYEQHNPKIFFYLGRALRASARNQVDTDQRLALKHGALAAFERARRLVPLDGTYPLELALTFDQMGRFAEAEAMYEAARLRDPRSISISQLYENHLQSWENQKQKDLVDQAEPRLPSPD